MTVEQRLRLVATVALLVVLAGCGESDAHKAAREDAHLTAEYYCTMEPGLTSAGSIYTDEFKTCVKQQTKRFLAEWEDAHPGE